MVRHCGSHSERGCFFRHMNKLLPKDLYTTLEEYAFMTANPGTVAVLYCAEDLLEPVFGSKTLRTLDTVIQNVQQVPSPSDKYRLRVEIKLDSIFEKSGYENALELGDDDNSMFFPVNYGTRDLQELTGKPVYAFYDEKKLVGLQRREL